MLMLDLSICIVTLNAIDYLRNCLRSIVEQAAYLNLMESNSSAATQPSDQPTPDQGRLNFELIVVDNGSNDQTVHMLQTEFPATRIILNGKNDGFARPINQALRLSAGQYMLILNPDTII